VQAQASLSSSLHKIKLCKHSALVDRWVHQRLFPCCCVNGYNLRVFCHYNVRRIANICFAKLVAMSM